MITGPLSTRALRRAGLLSGALTGTLVLAAATVGMVSSAGAAVSAPRLEKPAVQPSAAGGSDYFAGYQAEPVGGLASASATFTVPKATCNSTDKTDAAQYYTGVYTDTFNTYALVATICTSSGVSYGFDFATPNGYFDEAGDANVGDVVVTSLFQSGSSTWAEIHDLTNGEHWAADDPSAVGDTVVDIGTLNYAELESNPVPSFATFAMSNASVNGDYLGFESPAQANALDGSTTTIKSGKLHTTAAGSNFSLTFEKAS